MAMFTAEEGEGWQQVGDNLGPHRPDQASLLEELFHGDIGQTNPGQSNFYAQGDAGSILKSPDGTDFQLFDSSLNSPAGDAGSSLLPGGDTVGGSTMLDSLGKSMADIAGAGMPMGLLSQLFQFLMNLFTEGMKELGHQFNQSAAAAAADATKRLSY